MSFWSFIKDVMPTAMKAGSIIYGASQEAKATKQAAQQLQSGNTAATQVAQESRAAASPGLLATQEIIARGGKLNPVQEAAVQDSRAQALNALKGSSLRGSARATSAVVSDTDRRVRDNLAAQNQARADSAAGGLTQQYFNTGNTVSQGLMNTGEIDASSTLGQSKVRGQAIGDIGAIIADSLKGDLAKKRDSSYERVE